MEVLVVASSDTQSASGAVLEPSAGEERTGHRSRKGTGQMGTVLGPVQTRSSEDPPAGAQLVEVNVQAGDNC